MNEIDRARDALNHIDAGCARDEWVRAGMAAKSAELSFDDFHTWSATAGNYSGENECRTVWKSFSESGAVTAATLFKMATDQGWKDPKRLNGKRHTLTPTKGKIIAPKPAKQAESAVDVWNRCIPATNAEPYIFRKQGKPDGLRMYPASAPPLTIKGQSMVGYLAVPCWDGDKLLTLQFIPPDGGEKLNLPGASFGNGFFQAGEVTDRVFIIEGIGQAWACNAATGSAAVVTFGAGRMDRVAKALRAKYPAARLVIVADKGKETEAEKIAADISGEFVAMPQDKPVNFDCNDYLQEAGTEALAALVEQTKAPHDPFSLDAFALNGQSADLEQQLLADKFIIGRIAILGQATVIYAPPNTGKTLLLLAMLRNGIQSGEVDAGKVYFVNADDSFKGAVQKLKLAEKYGFKMLVPSHNGFKAEMMDAILRAQCLTNKARGMVLILDTMKKFTDLMSKSRGTDFMKAVREFVSHGGSVILLAHTNKNRNDEGGLIYAGTADVVDDIDCAYTLDEVTTEGGIKSVRFLNFKARGDNALEEVYQYSVTEGMSYAAKLESVRLLDKEEKQTAIRRKEVEAMLERNADAIQVIKDLIRSGTVKKTAIIKSAMSEGISKTKVIRALKEHEGNGVAAGKLWTVTIGEDNAHIYRLGVFA